MLQQLLPIPGFAPADPVASHLASMRCCWPEWEGPRVGDGVHGHCQVGMPIVHSLTHGGLRYRYMAPCRIESVSPDGETVVAVVAYESDCHCASHNGERLRLHLTEVWPPVHLLS